MRGYLLAEAENEIGKDSHVIGKKAINSNREFLLMKLKPPRLRRESIATFALIVPCPTMVKRLGVAFGYEPRTLAGDFSEQKKLSLMHGGL